MFRHFLFLALLGAALSKTAEQKIDFSLLAKLRNEGVANVAIEFVHPTQHIVDRVKLQNFESRGAKITSLKAQLQAVTTESQKNALALLKTHTGKVTGLWIVNRVYVEKITLAKVLEIAALPEVGHVREQFVAQLETVIPGDSQVNAEWNIDLIEASGAWSLPGGNNGSGAVVSTIDSGARQTHEALVNSWRADHGWFDPYDGSSTPIDTSFASQGTHVMGVIVGIGGIGVAPGAQWIACRGCSDFGCDESAIMVCGEWSACPTPPDGSSSDCSKAPNVVANGWLIAGQGDTSFRPVVEVWHAAGIIPIFTTGNSGPLCGTSRSPGDMDNVIGVAATTEEDVIAGSASRGPAVTGILKPDLTAPGANIRSASGTGDSDYLVLTGASANPHTAGVATLLMAHNPNFTYDQVKNFLQLSADRRLGSAEECGGTSTGDWPNNIYGWGRVNARQSLAAAIASGSS